MSAINWQQCLFVFISNSTEVRHLKDIAFGVKVLSNKGVSASSIVVFSNDPQAVVMLRSYGVNQVWALSDVASKLQSLSSDHVLVTVTGHGAPIGIDDTLGPANLCRHVRSIDGLHSGIVVLCQCFAGVFNYALAAENPQLVLIGATNLTSSLSAPISMDTSPGYESLGQWSANLFMINLFSWINDPVDIDGDGHFTILDAYKYAGAYANQHVANVKGRIFTELQQLYVTLMSQKLDQEVNPSVQNEMKVAATQRLIDTKLEIIHVSQEPWLLHANLARGMIMS